MLWIFQNAAHVAVLDPELTLSQPHTVTANTGIDALAHAIETYVSLKATPYHEFLQLSLSDF